MNPTRACLRAVLIRLFIEVVPAKVMDPLEYQGVSKWDTRLPM